MPVMYSTSIDWCKTEQIGDERHFQNKCDQGKRAQHGCPQHFILRLQRKDGLPCGTHIETVEDLTHIHCQESHGHAVRRNSLRHFKVTNFH
jgi:hypothetical protein